MQCIHLSAVELAEGLWAAVRFQNYLCELKNNVAAQDILPILLSRESLA